MRTTGLALAMLGAFGFAGKAILIKLAYRHGVDALTFLMLRMAMALPMFLALAWWAGRGKPALSRHDVLTVLGLGFCGYYLSSLLDFIGLQYISAGLERLILYLNPTIVLLLSWVMHGRRATARQLGAMALSYAGVLVVLGHEVKLAGANVTLGAGLVIASAVMYAVYLVQSGEAVRRLGALRLTGSATSVACVLCLIHFVVVHDVGLLATLPPEVYRLSLLNATLCTFIPVVAVMMAIERIGPSLTAQAGMIGPIATLLLATWVLSEPLTSGILLGTALVLTGVALLARVKPSPS